MARLQLYKRGKVWWIDGSVDGNRIRESTRTTDKKRAEQIAAKREREVHNTSVFGPESVLTFGTATGLYLDAGKSDRYLTPIFEKWEHRLVREIKPGNIHDLCRDLYPKAGPATMNRQVISPVQAIINHSAKRGLCAPIRVERFFVPKHKPKYATMQWIEAFMAAASPHLAALAQFMAMTGTRISEAVRLDWKDVDLVASTAYLRKTKNGDPRTAELPPALRVTLANLPGERKGKVFTYKTRQSIQTPWANAEARAQIMHIPPHDAGRRLFATAMLQGGVDAVTVAKAGGWKSVRMVLDVYAQPADTKEAVNKVFGTKESQTTQKKAESN